MKTIAHMTLTLLSLFFGLLALVSIGQSPMINELDDIRMIQFLGFPSIILSSGLAALIAVLGYRRTFLLPGLLNALSGIAGLVGGSQGVIDIVKIQNIVYEGHQGNNYHLIDLFTIAIVPISCVVISWLIYYYKRPVFRKETAHNQRLHRNAGKSGPR